jgi:hypothetical protein
VPARVTDKVCTSTSRNSRNFFLFILDSKLIKSTNNSYLILLKVNKLLSKIKKNKYLHIIIQERRGIKKEKKKNIQ